MCNSIAAATLIALFTTYVSDGRLLTAKTFHLITFITHAAGRRG